MSPGWWSGGRRESILLYLGLGVVALGLLSGSLGLALMSREGGDADDTPRVSTSAPVRDGLTSDSRPDVASEPDSTGSVDSSPATASSGVAPGTTGRSAQSPAPSTSTTGTEGEPTPSGTLPPAGDPAGRLAQAAGSATYRVLRLGQEAWQLTTVDVGVFDGQTYVDSVYRMEGDYLNLAQAPSLTQPSLPSAQSVTVRDNPAQLLDMGGGVTLIQWDEGGARVRVTSDLPRDNLLGLMDSLQEVSPEG